MSDPQYPPEGPLPTGSLDDFAFTFESLLESTRKRVSLSICALWTGDEDLVSPSCLKPCTSNDSGLPKYSAQDTADAAIAERRLHGVGAWKIQAAVLPGASLTAVCIGTQTHSWTALEKFTLRTDGHTTHSMQDVRFHICPCTFENILTSPDQHTPIPTTRGK